MAQQFPKHAKKQQTERAQIEEVAPGAWRLGLSPGPAGRYRLAQLDDYSGLARRSLPNRPPLHLSLQMRASTADLPGTWGFGLWNDPFNMGAPGHAKGIVLPALPNAAWFFFASPPNFLSLRDDLPAHGSMAAVFASPRLPSGVIALGALALPLLLLPPAVRRLRRLARRIVKEAGAVLTLDSTQWHLYEIDWSPQAVRLSVDGVCQMESSLAPQAPLGLVLWVDNQAAALLPGGHWSYHWLPNPEPVWIEARDIRIERPE